MSDPTFRQRRLGEALQMLRERAGLSQKDAAARLRYNHQKLSRIENGQVPDFHGLRAMLDVYGVIADEEAPYLDMYDRACQKGWWHPYGLQDWGYISLEHDARRVRTFQLGYVPGFLQVEEYMRAIFARSSVQRSRKLIETQIEVRLRRQERLVAEPPLLFQAIIAESALTNAMRSQLLHINHRGALSNVTIQVLPLAAGLHDGQFGSFTLLDFPDPEVLYIEHTAGAVHTENPDQVRATRLVFKHLSKLALTPDESAAWIERLATER